MRLIDGTNSITFFDLFNFGWLTTVVVDPDTVTSEIPIPLAAVPGLYDLEVITDNQNTYTLPDAFTILPPRWIY